MNRYAVKYQFLTEEDGDEFVECEGCGYPAPLAPFGSASPSLKGRKMLLCHLCAGTFAGTAVEYPSQYLEGQAASVLRSISFVGNAILDQLNAFMNTETAVAPPAAEEKGETNV